MIVVSLVIRFIKYIHRRGQNPVLGTAVGTGRQTGIIFELLLLLLQLLGLRFGVQFRSCRELGFGLLHFHLQGLWGCPNLRSLSNSVRVCSNQLFMSWLFKKANPEPVTTPAPSPAPVLAAAVPAPVPASAPAAPAPAPAPAAASAASASAPAPSLTAPKKTPSNVSQNVNDHAISSNTPPPAVTAAVQAQPSSSSTQRDAVAPEVLTVLYHLC
jgi:hypothetical protein